MEFLLATLINVMHTLWKSVCVQLVQTSGPGGSTVLSFALSGTNLFADTICGGVLRRPLSEMITSVQQLDTELPTQFALYQNYPNPFTPTTRIGYALRHASHVKLAVYKLLGQLVPTLIDYERPVGRFSAEWNGKNSTDRPVGSGVYFYTMGTRELTGGQTFLRTGKMKMTKSTTHSTNKLH